MTIPKDIDQLKIKLGETIDKKEQAEVLLELLKNDSSVNSHDTKSYIDRLLEVSNQIHSDHHQAWALYYKGQYERLRAAYDSALVTLRQALRLFEQTGDKKGIADSYSNIGNVYYQQVNYPEALNHHFTALKLREEIGDKQLIATSYNSIGVDYHYQGNYPDALKYHFTALRLRDEIGDKSAISLSYLNIANVYESQGNYPEALKNNFAALKLKTEIDDKQGIAHCYTNIGLVHLDQQNYPEALKYHLAALKLREEFSGKKDISASYNNIGNVYFEQGNYPEALKYHSAALKLFEDMGDKYCIASSYNNIGLLYEKDGNDPEALRNHFASLKLREEIGNKFGIAASHSNIGLIYFRQGNYQESLNDQTHALAIAEEIGAKSMIKVSSIALADTYKAIGDFENALKYYQKYQQIHEQILGEAAQKQLTDLHFMHNMQQKEKDLEIEQLRNVELKKEKERSETLLLNILPAEVADELKEKGTANAKLFDDVTVLFTDFVSFTKASERLTPQQLVDELHTCFSAFDEIMTRHGIEKIKTVGDAYLAISGLPQANAGHARNMVLAALEIRDYMLHRKKELGDVTFDVRIGVHSGSVVAGIVGVKKFAYDIWGDTVNTAARMEQNSQSGKVNISKSTYDLVKDHFDCEYRGEIEAKYKGKLKMYFVT